MLDICPEAFKQTMAQGLGSARRTRQVVANAHGDRSAKTCARLWSRIQQSGSSRTTDEAEASATSGSPPKRQLLPVFAGDPSHRQVGKSSGELACAQALLRAAAAEAGAVRSTDTSGFRVRANATLDDKAVRGVVQRSRHLTSTRYQKTFSVEVVWFSKKLGEDGAELFNLIESVLNCLVYNVTVNVEVVVHERVPKSDHIGPLLAHLLPDQSFGLEDVG